MMKELMEQLYGWDNKKQFMIVELNLIELTPDGGEIRNQEVLASDEAVARLFDLDLFGWQVKSYNWYNEMGTYTRMRIEVYRRNG